MEKQLNIVEESEVIVEELTNEELELATGGIGSGWIRTLTDDCPNSVIVCC